MKVTLKVEANEMEHVKSMSCYNNIMWRLKKTNDFGITHISERYDDVSDYPEYYLGHVPNGDFCSFTIGEGDPVPEDKIGTGGVWINIDICYPKGLIENCCTLKDSPSLPTEGSAK